MKTTEFMTAMMNYADICPFGAPNFKLPHVGKFWWDQLEGCSKQELAAVMTSLVAGGRFPSVNDVKEALGQPTKGLSDDAAARDAVARIREAVGRFGFYREEEALAYIGELGAEVVRTSMGGWQATCEHKSQDDLDMALARAREYAKVVLAKHRAGCPDLPPSLPSSGGGGVYGQLIKKVAQKLSLGPLN